MEVDGSKVFASYRDMLRQNLCDPPTEACFLNTCNYTTCGNLNSVKDLVWSYFDDNDISEIKYKIWSQQERCSLNSLVSEVDSFVEALFVSIPDVRKHDYISKAQAQYIKHVRDNLQDGQMLAVADFSENYSFLYQDSVQSVHYNNTQATIHPFAAYTLQDGIVVPVSCVIVSDTLEHNTSTFHVFQRKFIEFIKSRFAAIRHIIYFSDGAVSQYKNRFNMTNLLFHQKDFGISAEWHFFATAHGKGPSDELGGTLKRLSTRANLQGTTIQTVKQLFEWASRNCKLNVKFVSAVECSAEKEILKHRFDAAASIPGIRSMHAAIPSGTASIIMKPVFKSTTGSTFKILKICTQKRY